MRDISNKLTALRHEKGLSQEELAEKLSVTRQAISKWECGEALPDIENLILLANFYEISLDTLVGVERQENEQKNDTDKAYEYIDEHAGAKKSSLLYVIAQNLPYPILCVIIFFLWGSLLNAYNISWIIFLTVPVYYSLIDAISKRRFSSFAYPVLVTAIYMFIGIEWIFWHPGWVIFITIPIYYSIADGIDKHNHKRKK